MKISEVEDIDKLINDHFSEFRVQKTILDLLIKSQNIVSQKTNDIAFTNKILHLKFWCFLSASFLDLLSIVKGFLKATTDWEKIYYSKSGYLHIYEIIKNYEANKKDIYTDINLSMPELLPLFLKNSELLKNFKKEFDYEGKIKTIRHKSSGHIDKDFLVYYDSISSISSDECILAVENCLGFLKLTMMIMHDLTLKTTERENQDLNHPNNSFWNIVRDEMKKDGIIN